MISLRSRQYSGAVALMLFINALAAGFSAHADNPVIKVQVAVEHLYRPAYDGFATQTASLLDATNRLCESTVTDSPAPSAIDRLHQTREHFLDTVAAFSRVELLQVGPIMREYRLDRLYFWPDTRRFTKRQTRKLLDTMTRQGTDLSKTRSLQGKSVAVQGLAALEMLLFTTELTDIESDAVACGLSLDIAGNIDQLARELADAWADPNGIAGQLMHPAADAAQFRRDEEVTASLLSQISAGLELVARRKTLPMSRPGARWLDAPFSRSGATVINLQGNLDSLQSLLETTGMLRRAGLQRAIALEFRLARAHLDGLAEQDTYADPGGFATPQTRQRMRALQETVAGLALTTTEAIGPALRVRPGFNAADGD